MVCLFIEMAMFGWYVINTLAYAPYAILESIVGSRQENISGCRRLMLSTVRYTITRRQHATGDGWRRRHTTRHVICWFGHVIAVNGLPLLVTRWSRRR